LRLIARLPEAAPRPAKNARREMSSGMGANGTLVP